MANEFVVKNGAITPNLQLTGSTSGTITVLATATAGSNTLTLPAVTGTAVTTGDTGSVTNTMLAGSIANTKLANSSITVNGSSISLGGSTTITSNTTNALTIGSGLSGTSFNGSAGVTIAIDSTVATLTGIQTLTNKTLTSPAVTTSLTTGSTSFDLLNTTATTINFGGASTAISIGNTAHTGTTSIQHDLYVYGNITFGGGATQLSGTQLVIDDPLIYIGDNNVADITDLGIIGAYNNGTHLHTGLVRDASDSVWKLFSGMTSEPSSSTVDFTGVTYAPLKVGNLEYTGTLTGSTGVLNIGSGQVYKDASGNVGIGTTSPTSGVKLDVNGTIKIGTGTSASAGCIFTNANFGMLFQAYQASPALADFSWLNSAGTERMRIDSSGKVGIGNTNPLTKLDVYGAQVLNRGVIQAIDSTAQAAGTGAGLVLGGFYSASQTTSGVQIKASKTNGTAGDYGFDMSFLTLQNSTSNLTERMRITSAGGISFGSSGTAYGTSGQVLTSAGNAAPTWINQSSIAAGTATNITAYTINQNVGTANAVQHSDITTARVGSLTTGYVYYGNTGTKYAGFDGTNFVTSMPMSFNILGSSASCTGNAATATTATNVSGGSGAFGGLINTKTNNASFAGSNDSTLSVRGDPSYGAVMSFHRAGAYAANFGLDTDNVLKYGGWSVGSVYPVYHGGNPQPSVTGSSGSCTGNAATATTATSATYLNSSNYISRAGSSGNANTDFQNTPAGSVRHNGDDANLTNGPGNSWWFYNNYRHSNGSNYWGTQVAWGWEDNANRLATRNVSGGGFGAWVYYLNSSNYTSYAPSLTGSGASGTWGISVTGSSASCTGNAATATTSNKLNPLSGDANYKLAYTADGQRSNAGEWGRVVMQYQPNAQTYGVRVDRADYADSAGNAIGVGQTWQNLLTSRAKTTTYTNSTGRTIMLAVTFNALASGAGCTHILDGVTVFGFGFSASGGAGSNGAVMLVPSGSTYSVTNGGTLRTWFELR